MKFQVLQDNFGNQTGIYIPIQDWENIKKSYPNIEKIDEDLPQWQKDILDTRLSDLNNSNKLEPIDELFKALDSDI